MNLKEAAAKYGDYLIEMRRCFHAHPEVSGEEYETSKRIKAELDKFGIAWRPCGLETGILATIQGGKPGKTILLRGDMDALTVQEETELPYASEVSGVMHACGHDCHISTLLTAARVLNDVKADLCGTVLLAFQPAEETAQGAKSMIENGALDGVDGCFGIHVWSNVPAGQVALAPGPRMAAADQFSIDIKGKGGHASAPHQCVDAAVVASAMVTNLQSIVSREVDPGDPAVLTVGRIEAGTRWNVVAEYGRLEGTTRYFSRDLYQRFPEMMERVVTQTAQTFRAEAKLNYDRIVPPAINDDKMTEVAIGAARKAISADAVIAIDRITGGEDFAYFMEKVPGAIALMGVGNESCGAVWPQHSGKYRVDESALINSVLLYAQVAADFNAG
ncbi:M20 family metallopeptidase [uncultured Oscillibacter sp.]|uniref:M20 metallopeptidase family protein n=1 Tax=uncultured Oscillibacter sp. TaxID=876091 RepID=UPI0025CE61DF|nr:amidohydrolase [uncultured Oscillibacter sp.]